MNDHVVKTHPDRHQTTKTSSCPESGSSINLLVSLSNQCLSEAICALLHQESLGYQVCHRNNLTENFTPDILLTDHSGLTAAPPENLAEIKILVFDDGLDDRQKEEIFSFPRVMGLIRTDCDVDLFLKAIECVLDDQIWIDSKTATSIIRSKRHLSSARSDTFLSKRERTILDLILQGCRNKEIANEIFLSESTVKFYVSRILKKHKVPTRSQLISKLYNNQDPLH